MKKTLIALPIIWWEPQHPDTKAALADINRRLEALEKRPYPVPGEVVELPSCCDATGEPCACGERRCAPDPEPSCGVAQPGDIGGWYDCDLPQGHEGPHECDGTEWSDPAPVPECCTDGTCDSCAPLFAWAEYRNDFQPNPNDVEAAAKAFRTAWHAARIRYSPDPAPTPEWRRLVDEGETAIWADCGPEIGLSRVLQDLSRLANPATSHMISIYALARIVAIAESQVGDGWQADPRAWPMTPNMPTLLTFMTSGGYGEPRWRALGDAASARLRDLTEEEI